MAEKFKRDEARKFDWNVRGSSTEAVRKKTLYIYCGLMIAFFASMVVHMLGKGAGDGLLSSEEGLPEARYLLRCEVEVDVGGGWQGSRRKR